MRTLFFGFGRDLITPPVAWLGIICYTLQIYYDFSGYTDMAIGLGRDVWILPFSENFNYPYSAVSITDFWRRWHITLSALLRDYLYIPLGGESCAGPWRVYVNLLIVFFLCGLWHGATWTFVVWGLYHGAFLILERIGLGEMAGVRGPHPGLCGIYMLRPVMIDWVFVPPSAVVSHWRSIICGDCGCSGSFGQSRPAFIFCLLFINSPHDAHDHCRCCNVGIVVFGFAGYSRVHGTAIEAGRRGFWEGDCLRSV